MSQIIREHQLQKSNVAFDILISSLKSLCDPEMLSEALQFLDNCLSYVVKKTVQYHEMFHNVVASVLTEASSGTSVLYSDLLLIVFAEQLPFLIKRVDESVVTRILQWLSHYLELHWISIRQPDASNPEALVDAQVLHRIRDRMIAATAIQGSGIYLKKAFKEPPELNLSSDVATGICFSGTSMLTEESQDHEMDGPSILDEMPAGPPQEDEDHRGLRRWEQEDMAVAISEGMLGELILCLCSQHAEIRQHAMSKVKKVKETLWNLHVRSDLLLVLYLFR